MNQLKMDDEFNIGAGTKSSVDEIKRDITPFAP